jgi:peptidoglycan/xylan/chitin deacetylase (PgdA/CDA1 family)
VADEVPELEARCQEKQLRAISLLYHDVVDRGGDDASGFPGAGPARYKLEKDEFERHLDAIEAVVKSTPALVDDALADRNDDGPPWLLTFDDGGASALAAAESLTRRGWRGHFFITVDRIGSPAFVDAEGVRALAELGHAVGSHSCSHPERMSRCTREELLYEWGRSTEVLSELLGTRVAIASVPAGWYARRVAHAAADVGIEALFTSEPVAPVRDVAGCRVFGRFTIQRGVSADVAAAIAAGRATPRLRQFAGWNAKKVLKTIGGDTYLRARGRLVGRG